MKESIFPGNVREKGTDSILSNSPDRVYFPLLWFSFGKSICCVSRHIFTAVTARPPVTNETPSRCWVPSIVQSRAQAHFALRGQLAQRLPQHGVGQAVGGQ